MRGLVVGVGLILGSAIATDATGTDAIGVDAIGTDAIAADGAPGQSQDGRIVEARDGDTVIVRENMRVRVVKRTSGVVRIAVNQARGFVLVLLDKNSDGRADWAYRFDIDQPYPIDAPWEGAADVDEYFDLGRPSGSIAVVTPQGVIQFLSGPPGQQDPHAVSNALAIVRSHGSRSGVVGDTFDVVESYWLTGRENEYRAGTGPNVQTSLSMKAVAASRDGSLPPEAFVAPRRIHRVDALQPEAARAANVSGMVIVEISVGVHGTVTKARVLRSIPLLDEAALTAVRQWRYEPARRHGKPVEQTTTEGVFVGPPPTAVQPRP